MIQFVCDSCTVVKQAGDVWMLGMAAESLGLAASRREVTILPIWDRSRAVHPLAVHFCSLECKDNYMAALFGPETPERHIIVERVAPVATESVIERTSASPVIRQKSVRGNKRSTTKSVKSKKRRAA